MNGNDIQLLQRYVSERSEAAFADLVRQRIALVYSTALRQTNGDAHLAEDITQEVFSDLARKAPRLTRHTSLVGWLYTSTRYAAATLRRAEGRRRRRELEAHAMNQLFQPAGTDPTWEQIRLTLDAAMDDLQKADREAVLLRFFEGLPLVEVGAHFGVSENTARMRVDRALEKLRHALVKRGVAAPVTALTGLLTAEALTAAPTGLAASVAAAAVSGAATGGGTAAALLKLVAMNKVRSGIVGALVLAGVAVPLLIEQQAEAKLRDQAQAMRTKSDRIAALHGENERLSDVLTRAGSSPTPAREQFSEVLRLRGEVGRLEAAVRELRKARTNGPLSREEVLASMRQMYSERVKRLKQLFAANPAQAVPELKYLTDRDWLGIVEYDHHRIDPENSHVMSMARARGQIHFAKAMLTDAFEQYARNNNKQFPTDVSQLAPYFKSPVDEGVLRDWVVLPTSSLPPVMRVDEDWVITQKAPVNPELDQRILVGFQIFRMGYGSNQWDSAH